MLLLPAASACCCAKASMLLKKSRQVRGLCGADARLGFQEGVKTLQKSRKTSCFLLVYAKKNSEIPRFSDFGKFAP